jgi:hypothetical protein
MMAGGDPHPPIGFLESGLTINSGFPCFASTKRPFVISHTRASADVYGDRVGDGTRLGAVGQFRPVKDRLDRNRSFVGKRRG